MLSDIDATTTEWFDSKAKTGSSTRNTVAEKTTLTERILSKPAKRKRERQPIQKIKK